jgi:F0F1-type ATP synthase assembly protein I
MERLPAEERSAMSVAWAWSSRIIAVATTLIVPALIGAWIGQKFGTVWTIVLLLFGFALGATGAVLQLMRIAQDYKSESSSHGKGGPS